MKDELFYVAISEYLVSEDEVLDNLAEHRAWSKDAYDRGIMLFSGRQDPPTGGVLAFRARSRAEADDFVASDPFVRGRSVSVPGVRLHPYTLPVAESGLRHVLQRTADLALHGAEVGVVAARCVGRWWRDRSARRQRRPRGPTAAVVPIRPPPSGTGCRSGRSSSCSPGSGLPWSSSDSTTSGAAASCSQPAFSWRPSYGCSCPRRMPACSRSAPGGSMSSSWASSGWA